ncbi:MAG: T9SS type A sorting domain-containing protein [Candidatus Kapabacteria bacterium]|nr:T9SS type A sorting domain-containing protein [Candidatus Kapabacteria bacterium]
MKAKISSKLIIFLWFVSTVLLLSEENLIYNGDFSLGNVGFNTDYTYSTGIPFGPGYYTIGTNPQLIHPGFAPCKDHTQDSAKLMMFFDSYTVPNKLVWSQEVDVKKSSVYKFSMWATKLVYYDDSDFQIKINGKALEPDFHIGKASCTWSYFESKWNSNSDSKALIEIYNLSTFSKGNDIAIDDLAFVLDSVCVEEINLADDIEICIGDTVVLGNENGKRSDLRFIWSPNLYLDNPYVGNPKCHARENITYYIQAENLETGCMSYDTINVVIKMTENLDVADDIEICFGDTVVLGNENGKRRELRFVWHPNLYLDNPYAGNPKCHAHENIRYYIQVENLETGCMSYDTIDVVIKIPENFELGEDVSICLGETIVLGNENWKRPELQYVWHPPLYLDNSFVGNPRCDARENITYFIQVKNLDDGCTTYDTIDVVVNIPENIDITASSLTICNDPVTLTASEGFTDYKWSNGAKESVIQITKQGVYIVQARDKNGCISVDSIKIILELELDLPETIDLGIMCVGDEKDTTINLTNLGNLPILISAVEYDKKNGFFELDYTGLLDKEIVKNFSHPIKIHIKARKEGSYSEKVTLFFETPCKVEFEIGIKFSIYDLPVYEAGEDIIKCPDESITLGGINGKNPDWIYSWSPAEYLNNPNIGNPICNAIVDTKYTVIVRHKTSGCLAYDTINVFVHEPEPISIEASSLVICDNSVTLRASDGFPGYVWSNGDSTQVIQVNEAGVYTVSAIDSNGCLTTASIEIINANIKLVIPTFIEFEPICFGNDSEKSIEIKNIGNVNVKVKIIKLIGSDLITPEKISFEDSVLTINESGHLIFKIRAIQVGMITAKILIEIDYPCPASYEIEISCLILDSEIIDLGTNYTICQGSSVQLGNENGKNSRLKFKWIPEDFLDNPFIGNPICNSPSDIEYIVEITDIETGCVSYDTINVFYVIPEVLEIIVSSDYFCDGSVLLTATEGFNNFKWSTGDTTQSIETVGSGKYTLSAYDKNGCLSIAEITITDFDLEFDIPDLIEIYAACYGEVVESLLDVVNKGKETLRISEILIEGDTAIFKSNADLLIGQRIKPGESLKLLINSLPPTLDTFAANLLIKIDEPCTKSFNVDLRLIVKPPIVHIIVPDTVVIIGEELCIPIMGNINCDIPGLPVSYRLVLSLNKTLFKPDHIVSGNIVSIKESGDKFIIEIEDFDVLLYDYPTVINHLCGLVLLGNKTYDSIEIIEFESNSGNEYTSTPGSIKTDVCAPQIRPIQMYIPTYMTINENPTNSSVNLQIGSSEEGEFELEILDLVGISVYKHQWSKHNREHIETNMTIDCSSLNQGLYIIKLITPWNLKTEKLLIVK